MGIFDFIAEVGAEEDAMQNMQQGNVVGAMMDMEAAQQFAQGNVTQGIEDEILGDIL
jgi:hypothetical protein